MNADDIAKLTPDAFEKLSTAQKEDVIRVNDEEIRDWFAFCPDCKKRVTGKLWKLRQWKCDCGK